MCFQQPKVLSQRDFVALADFREWVDGLLPGLNPGLPAATCRQEPPGPASWLLTLSPDP